MKMQQENMEAAQLSHNTVFLTAIKMYHVHIPTRKLCSFDITICC